MRQELRSSDVFVKEDLRCMLQAILATNEALSMQYPDDQRIQLRRDGFNAAVVAIAMALNIDLQFQRGRYATD